MNKDQYTGSEQHIDFFYPHKDMSFADRDQLTEWIDRYKEDNHDLI